MDTEKRLADPVAAESVKTGWEDIDLFDLEASWFSSEVNEVIVPLFDQGSVALAKWEKERKDLLKTQLAKAEDEDEANTAYSLADFEDWRNTQRGQVLGAAALHYLYSTLKARLYELARCFDQSHPPAPGRYKKKKRGVERELGCLQEEYLQRFGVEFEKSPLYQSVVELALARNAGIHRGALREYIQKVESPRFYRGGEFFVEREAFLKILDETERFFDWVVKELTPIRKATASAKQTKAPPEELPS